jgi:hypothetical protein
MFTLWDVSVAVYGYTEPNGEAAYELKQLPFYLHFCFLFWCLTATGELERVGSRDYMIEQLHIGQTLGFTVVVTAASVLLVCWFACRNIFADSFFYQDVAGT